MSRPPKNIWLQWGVDNGEDGVTWCTDQINDEDVEYVLKEKITGLVKELEEYYSDAWDACYCDPDSEYRCPMCIIKDLLEEIGE